MILVIDNYDSFVYNLVQYLGVLGAETRVYRNDAIHLEDIAPMSPKAIVISPGPRSPKDAGISVPLVKRYAGFFPILGVCLGHQAIAEAYGAVLRRAVRPMHGKTSLVWHDGTGCLRGLESPLEVCRYHSLAVEESTLPDELLVTARSEDGEVMAVRHRWLPVEGVQFHPESIFTNRGMDILANFLHSVDAHYLTGAVNQQVLQRQESGRGHGGCGPSL
ncbi:MAG: aminodeoxychorismate/anthranilate synthase component II [Firmicutes bacterium]|nr:aminodeoxychorismate/anthranilate synthase component II [Bacillota bacterium]